MASCLCRSSLVAANCTKYKIWPWSGGAQSFTMRSNSSEAPKQDVFGQLAKEFQETDDKRNTITRRLFSEVRKNEQQQQPAWRHKFDRSADSEQPSLFATHGRKPSSELIKNKKFGTRMGSEQPFMPAIRQHVQQKRPTWKDKFGTMGVPLKAAEFEPVYDQNFEASWNNMDECCDEMKSLVKEGQLSRAHELLETVCRSDDMRPNAFLYNILIGAYGRVGDTKRAFKLFRQMKERQLSPDESTYTSLFNACANCPSKQEGLYRATQLCEKIHAKGWIPNTTNYLAMFKAFGRCGDVRSAFRIADEMTGAGHMLDTRVLESLLSACITDTQRGFHWALQVWRRFRQKEIRPTLHAYHLFLRVLKECGTGSLPLTPEQLYIGSYTSSLPKDFKTTALVPAPVLETPESRLAAVGGINAFLANLANDRLRPDVCTFTDLMMILPNSTSAETSLLSIMKQYGVKPDTSFFNILIKRRNFRGDYTAALDIVAQMQVEAVVPDLVTFGVLALGCSSKREAQRLLADMIRAGFRPNIEIFGAFIKNACWRFNWPYVSEMLAQMQEHQVLPNDRLLKRIEKAIATTKEMLVLLEKGQEVPFIFTKFSQPENVQAFQLFVTVYKGWLQTTPISPELYEQQTYSFPKR